jgi:NADH-quinone oxidoreductase subunit J
MNAIPFQDYIVVAIFALSVGLTIAGAIGAAFSTRIIRGVTGLMICCVGLAGLYYFLNSPFLALMEILIYVGAVCITIVFGVMLSETDEPPHQEKPRHAILWGGAAILACLAILGGLAHLATTGPWKVPATLTSDGSVQAIGLALLTTYSLPFELISLVLLVAILGALVIARSGRTKE